MKGINRNQKLTFKDKLEFFATEGYTIFGLDILNEFFEQEEIESYILAVLGFHKNIRMFFELSESLKREVKTYKSELNLCTNTYYSGWWPAASYKDVRDGVNFDLEYLHSQDYYKSNPKNLFPHEEKIRELSNELSAFNLPRLGTCGYNICSFLGQSTFRFLGEFFHKTINTNIPPHTLQIKGAYYKQSLELPTHIDKGFIQHIIGPANNIHIMSPKSGKSKSIDLDVGEILLFTGYNFREKLLSLNEKLPHPLLHSVSAQDGRISIVLNTFAIS